MKSNYIAYPFALLLLSFLVLGAEKDEPRPAAERVSLIQLLTTPEKYDRKLVGVRGYFHGEFESSGLYICEEHARYSLRESAIWIGTRAGNADTNYIERLNNTFVYVEGVFHHIPGGGGHSGMGTGELNEITHRLKLPARESLSPETSGRDNGRN